jgi:hypothetical protein
MALNSLVAFVKNPTIKKRAEDFSQRMHGQFAGESHSASIYERYVGGCINRRNGGEPARSKTGDWRTKLFEVSSAYARHRCAGFGRPMAQCILRAPGFGDEKMNPHWRKLCDSLFHGYQGSARAMVPLRRPSLRATASCGGSGGEVMGSQTARLSHPCALH